MTTVVTDNPAAGRFELTVDGRLVGKAEYQRIGTALAVTHTEIDPAFEGQGLGSVLARTVLDRARAAGEAVLPYCPFLNAYMKRHSEYVDLVPESERASFGL